MTNKTSFLGFEVEGAGGVGENSYRVPQISIEEFQVVVQNVLRHPEVTGIAWTQYTPYFNDGEPCVFGTGEVTFSFAGVTLPESGHYFDYTWQEEEYEETGRVWLNTYQDEFEAVVGKDDKVWGEWKGSYRNREYTWAEGSGPEHAPNPQLFTDVHEFIRVLEGGAANHAVEDLFGDHAIVKIDKLTNKVIIDEYYHD